MYISKADILNRSLEAASLRINSSILTATDSVSKFLQTNYNTWLNDETANNIHFKTKITHLTSDSVINENTEKYNGNTYRFSFPSDLLFIITDENDSILYIDGKFYSNKSEIDLKYVGAISDGDYITESFVEVMKYRIALELCNRFSLNSKLSIVSQKYNEAKAKFNIKNSMSQSKKQYDSYIDNGESYLEILI